MIRINVDLWPHGIRAGSERMATLDLIQTRRPDYRYIMRDTKGAVLSAGRYHCPLSAHKNPWHHLAIVVPLAMADLTHLKPDYCHSELDKP